MFKTNKRNTRRCIRLCWTIGAMSLLALQTPGYAKSETQTKPLHGMAMHGQPKYPPGFKHFEHVNTNAPKGGHIRYAALGSFDSFNVFIHKGIKADGIGRIYDTLMTNAPDEPFTIYGLVAEHIEVPDDRSWATFYINPEARFHDGHPITAEDVKFSLDIVKEKGSPFYKTYYQDILKAEILDTLTIKFHFRANGNRELPLISASLTVLPKHYWANLEFDKTTLTPPLGSGPYKIKNFEPGRSITYERYNDYWAKDLPVNVGRHNLNTITLDYFRDGTVALEAFKAGDLHFREENNSKSWATAYHGPLFDQGKVLTKEFVHARSTGMQGFAYNTRRPIFKDRRVREALAYAFDFEWTNRQLFYGAYARTHSFFSNSELAAQDTPKGRELEILNQFKDQLPREVFTEVYAPPKTNGSGALRKNLRTALRLLKESGWVVKNKKLVNQKTNEAFEFEIIIHQAAFERIILPFIKNLEKIGITASVRRIDLPQYIRRLQAFDFDMVVHSIGQSLSPGNEQHSLWHSDQADQTASRNIIGIKNPVVDELVEMVISAPSREELVYRTRALDRVLLWHHYVIPQWHIRHDRVAYWRLLKHPDQLPPYGIDFESWWVKNGASMANAQ